MNKIDNLIVALVTPFNQDYTIDKTSLIKLLEFHNNNKTNSLVLCGSTGESSLLSNNEKEEIIKLGIKYFKKPIIIGCGSPSTQIALEQAQNAQKLGANALLVISPYYSKPSQEGLLKHFTYIHDNTDLDIILYNNPSRCMVNIELETVNKLFELKRIIGIKDSTHDVTRVTYLKQKFKEKKIFCGDDILLPAFMSHGADGLISVIGNILPNLLHDAITFYKKSEIENFNNIYNNIFPLLQSLLLNTNPINIKSVLEIKGMCKKYLRLPLIHADQLMIEKLNKIVNNL